MEALWQKLQFWKKQKTPKEGVDYKLYNFPDSDVTGVHLLKGEYRNVIYCYGKVKFIEEGYLARLSFSFEIIEPGEYDIETLKNDEKFVTIMGDILSHLILTEPVYNESIRTNDTEESDLQ